MESNIKSSKESSRTSGNYHSPEVCRWRTFAASSAEIISVHVNNLGSVNALSLTVVAFHQIR
jgi:hypothetical protein